VIPIDHAITELQAGIDRAYEFMDRNAIFTALALATLSSDIARLQRHIALRDYAFPDSPGLAFVIPARPYSELNSETIEWLDEIVGRDSYVIFSDILGITFARDSDAFASRLRWS
jgi:hypothetical protein